MVPTGATAVLTDDFETDQGWTVTNLGADSGDWQRGVPVNDPDWPFAPTSDSDGSGACYLTENAAGNTDVDGGPTHLISPTLNLDGIDARISFARWMFSSDEGEGCCEDFLTVSVSDDNGQNWVDVPELTTTGTGSAWETASFFVSDYLTPTAQVRVPSGRKLSRFST